MRLRTSPARAAAVHLAVLALVFGPVQPASAYAGLGPMLPMIGSGIVLAFVFIVTMLGAVAYPLRMALAKLRRKPAPGVAAQ